MSTFTPNMGLEKPDIGASVDQWGTAWNNNADLDDAHNHTTGQGVKVPVAGLNMNADLPMGTFGITQLKVADFAGVLASAVTSYATALYVNSADNELYWRTSGGSDVKLTSGTSLNAALLGGFTGDYGSGGSTASFTSGTSIFNFLRAANHRAFMDCSDIRLFQGTVGITNAVKIRSPNALAASYDLVLPAAVPATTNVLSMSAAGVLTTGEKRPTRTRHIPACAGANSVGSGVFGNGGQWQAAAGTDVLSIPIILDEGERITRVDLRVDPGGAGAVGAFFVLRRSNEDGTVTNVATSGSTSGAAVQTISVTGLAETAGTTLVSWSIDFDAGQAADIVQTALVHTDMP